MHCSTWSFRLVAFCFKDFSSNFFSERLEARTKDVNDMMLVKVCNNKRDSLGGMFKENSGILEWKTQVFMQKDPIRTPG